MTNINFSNYFQPESIEGDLGSFKKALDCIESIPLLNGKKESIKIERRKLQINAYGLTAYTIRNLAKCPVLYSIDGTRGGELKIVFDRD